MAHLEEPHFDDEEYCQYCTVHKITVHIRNACLAQQSSQTTIHFYQKVGIPLSLVKSASINS